MSATGDRSRSRAPARRHVRARVPRARGRLPRRQGRRRVADLGRRDGLHRLHGPDRRLRQVPRSHVRPDQAARLLRHEGAVRSARRAEGDPGDPGRDLRQRQGADEAERKRAAIEGPIERADRPLQEEALRRARRHAAGRRAGRHPQAREGRARPPSRRSPTTISRSCGSTPDKILEIMPAADRKKYRELQRQLDQRAAAGAVPSLPAFWTVEVDPKKELEKSYILTSGDPDRPEKKTTKSQPGWPFAPADDRLPRGPDRGVLRLADGARESAVRPGGRQPALAMALRRGPAQDAQRLRQAGRDARAIRACSTGWPSEFVRPRVPHEGDAPADRHLGDLQAGLGGRPGAVATADIAADPDERPSLALPPPPARGRADLGFDPGRGRRPRPDGRRPVVRPVRRPAAAASAGRPPAASPTAAPPT